MWLWDCLFLSLPRQPAAIRFLLGIRHISGLMTVRKRKWETRNSALTEKLCHEHIDRVSWDNIRRKDIHVTHVFIQIILMLKNVVVSLSSISTFNMVFFFSILSYYVGHNALLHLTFTLVLYGKFLTSFFFFLTNKDIQAQLASIVIIHRTCIL